MSYNQDYLDVFQLMPDGTLVLTPDQKAALTAIIGFLDSRAQVFLLSGYAGTGKTTLVRQLLRHFDNVKRPVTVAAPTGRAAMVIRERTGRKASTVHGMIYDYERLEHRRETAEGSFQFQFKLRANNSDVNEVYIVDEASMIGDVATETEFLRFGSGRLLNDLYAYALSGGLGRKVIFVGDAAQLPPVGMTYSPALDSSHWEAAFQLGVQQAELTSVVRQGEGGILTLATSLREAIRQQKFNTFRLPTADATVARLADGDFVTTYTDAARTHGVEGVIVVTYSNGRALEYNQTIRERRYNQTNAPLRNQDRLVVVQNSRQGDHQLFNGQFVDVAEVGCVVREANVPVRVKGSNTQIRQLAFRECRVTYVTNGLKHTISRLALDYFLTATEGSLDPLDQRALYIDFEKRMREEGIRPKMAEFKQRIQTDRYFNALRVKYGYAVTCHKSQGGEWDAVFVDFGGTGGKHNESFYRWAYTAVTRASTRLYCLNAPDFSPVTAIAIGEIKRLSAKPKNATALREDFITERRLRIQEGCRTRGIDVDIADGQNHLVTRFSRGVDTVRAHLWYKTGSFSKDQYINSVASALLTEVGVLLAEEVPAPTPAFGGMHVFQRDLYETIVSCAETLGLRLTNLLHDDWQDRYILQRGTDYAVLSLRYNSKLSYTSATASSTSEELDEVLRRLLPELNPAAEAAA